MYSPQLGRFLSPDPLTRDPTLMYDNNWFGDQLKLMRNQYGYCSNNPVNATDPSGLIEATLCAAKGKCNLTEVSPIATQGPYIGNQISYACPAGYTRYDIAELVKGLLKTFVHCYKCESGTPPCQTCIFEIQKYTVTYKYGPNKTINYELNKVACKCS